MEIYRVSKCDRGIIKRVHSCRAARASNISRTPITTKRLLIILLFTSNRSSALELLLKRIPVQTMNQNKIVTRDQSRKM